MKRQEAAQWTENFKNLKTAKPRDDSSISETEARARELTGEARELASKAREIEDAVYDLKAINPHRRPVVDTRTREELLETIESKAQEVAYALAEIQVK